MVEITPPATAVSAHISRQLEKRATALKLSTPGLPFKSIAMDGQYYGRYGQALDTKYPTVAQALEERLALMGRMWSHQGTLEFVDAKGSFHIARDVESNRAALEAAGFRYDSSHFTTFTNGTTPLGENEALFWEILHTPEHAQERLDWAVTRHGSLEEINAAIAQGASISKGSGVNGQPLIFSAIAHTNVEERDAIVRRLLPESPHTPTPYGPYAPA